MRSEIASLALLEQLVEIRSVYPQEQEIATFIERYLLQLGFEVKRVVTASDRPNLIGVFGQAETYLGFYGHMDTVPPASDYQRDPFSVEVDGDIVRGLGVCDMKGGLTCILQAAAWAVEQKLPIKVIFGVDEEDISQGAHDLVDSGLLADIGFLIVAESGQIIDFSQPVSVCLGRKGRIVFELEVKGRSAHAAESHRGINAIEKAALLIQELSKLNLPSHERLGPCSVVVQGINSECGAFSVPDRCVVTLSLLTIPGMLGRDFEAQIAALGKRLEIDLSVRRKMRKTPYGDACEIDQFNPFYQRLESEVLQPQGVVPIYTPSVADENVFANRLGIPVLSVGVIGGGDHTCDEWSRLSSFTAVIETYRRAISLWNSHSIRKNK